MSGRDQSDAIWIRQQEQYPKPGTRHSSIDFGPSSRFAFGRSMSINSEGASTCSSSPPNSPFEMSSKSGALNIPPGGGRSRTSSFSAGYGPSYGAHDNTASSFEKDPYLIHSPLSTSAPGRDSLFRRSNSISTGYEYGNGKSSGKNSANLGPIDEVGKMYHFGDALKRSVGQLFSAPKMMPVPKSAEGPREKRKQGQMQDRVVSMLCESAIR